MTELHTQISQKLYPIIAEKLNVPISDISPDKNFRDDFGADSLDTVELVMSIEDRLFIKVKDEEAENIRTVGDALKIVTEKLAPIKTPTHPQNELSTQTPTE